MEKKYTSSIHNEVLGSWFKVMLQHIVCLHFGCRQMNAENWSNFWFQCYYQLPFSNPCLRLEREIFQWYIFSVQWYIWYWTEGVLNYLIIFQIRFNFIYKSLKRSTFPFEWWANDERTVSERWTHAERTVNARWAIDERTQKWESRTFQGL